MGCTHSEIETWNSTHLAAGAAPLFELDRKGTSRPTLVEDLGDSGQVRG